MSSSPESVSFYHFLGHSLSIMERECPPAYQGMCEILLRRKVMVAVDAEQMTLSFEPGRVFLQPAPDAEAEVIVRTTRPVILDLTDGKYTLQQAVMDGCISIQGGLQDLIRFYDGWLTYMRGAVHCTSIPGLLDRYRDAG